MRCANVLCIQNTKAFSSFDLYDIRTVHCTLLVHIIQYIDKLETPTNTFTKKCVNVLNVNALVVVNYRNDAAAGFVFLTCVCMRAYTRLM